MHTFDALAATPAAREALQKLMLRRYGWAAERIERCARAIDAHHELRTQRASGPEVEALRLADRIELTGGLLSAGVSRAHRREIAVAIPRTGLVSELTREVGRVARERPLTLPRIFLRPPG